jgi:hypothetical protein
LSSALKVKDRHQQTQKNNILYEAKSQENKQKIWKKSLKQSDAFFTPELKTPVVILDIDFT